MRQLDLVELESPTTSELLQAFAWETLTNSLRTSLSLSLRTQLTQHSLISQHTKLCISKLGNLACQPAF